MKTTILFMLLILALFISACVTSAEGGLAEEAVKDSESTKTAVAPKPEPNNMLQNSSFKKPMSHAVPARQDLEVSQ